MRTWLAIALLGAGAASAADEIQFYQTVDRNEVGTDDTFRLTLVVGNAPDSATPQFPAPQDFELLSRSQSTEMSYHFGGGGPGAIQHVTKFVLVMRATKAGKLTIPPAVLTTANKTYRTAAIEMTARKGHLNDPNARAQRPNPFGQLPDPFQNFFPQFPGDDSQEGGPPNINVPRSDSDLFLKATVDKDSLFVGEQVTLSLWVFSRVDISSVDQMSMPKLDGFWSEDIDSPTQLAPEQRVLNGIPYKAFLLKRLALFPVKSGAITIGPTGVDITTGFLFRASRVHRDSNELVIKVKPLPGGAPPGFSANNVGKWRLGVEANPQQVELGQPVTFRVILDGRGNLKNVSSPPLTGPPALKIYDPTITDKVAIGHGKFGGRRIQEYLVMPQQTGVFEVPALTFAYFDPETSRYETSRTDPIILNVRPGQGGVSSATPSSGSNAAQAAQPKNVLAAGGLKPLRLAALFAPSPEPVWRKRFFVPVVLGPAVLWFAIWIITGIVGALLRENAGSLKRKKARAARKRLAGAEKLRATGESSAFYGEVEKALVGFLEAKLGLPVAGLTRDGLAEKMKSAGVREDRAKKVLRVLDACDVGRFAPGAGDGVRSQVLDQAEEAMEAWDAR